MSVKIPEKISGPSAGLMFSLAVYDTLTPGSLTDGEVVAGTGEIRPDGSVGPIGGIDQKIAGAARDGAELFLVPPDNCPDIAGVDSDPMRLVMAKTMHSARVALETWAEDPDADLPLAPTSRPPSRCSGVGPMSGTSGLFSTSTSTPPWPPRSSRSSPTSPGRPGPARPSLRAGRHRPAGRPRAQARPRRWGSTPRPRRAP